MLVPNSLISLPPSKFASLPSAQKVKGQAVKHILDRTDDAACRSVETRRQRGHSWSVPAVAGGNDMITLYGFGRIFPEGHGETKDLWAQWALEEAGLPYRVHAFDHTGGELDGDAYGRNSHFHRAGAKAK